MVFKAENNIKPSCSVDLDQSRMFISMLHKLKILKYSSEIFVSSCTFTCMKKLINLSKLTIILLPSQQYLHENSILVNTYE